MSNLNLDIERVCMLKEAMPETLTSALYVLLPLLKYRGQILSYQRISQFQHELTGEEASIDSIRTAIKRLRSSISSIGWPVTIRTYSGLGYQLIAPEWWDWRAACREAAR